VPADQEDHKLFSNKEFNITSLAVVVAVDTEDGELQLSVDGEVSVDSVVFQPSDGIR
jgi:hypothetical protein